MAEISLLGVDCEDTERGERGKRGKRGHRGPPANALLKFAGLVASAGEGGSPASSFLADTGISFAIQSVFTAPNYPVAHAFDARNLATNILQGSVVPVGGSIVFELLRNGVLVPGFSITYGPGEGGIKTVEAGPAAYAIGDTFDLRATSSGLVVDDVNVSATIGTE
jgi:hypothetical protein